MNVQSQSAVESRRSFCVKLLVASVAGSIGCTKLGERSPSNAVRTVQPGIGAFSEDSKISFKQVYEYAYRDRLIPLMLGICAEMGRERALEMLKKVGADKAVKEAQDWAKETGKNDLESWIADQRSPDYFTSHVRAFTIVEDTKHAFEVKVTDCLLARTFRAANAGDIGYACFCSGDLAAVPAYNRQMELIRTKTLMQGDECCNHRYVLRDV